MAVRPRVLVETELQARIEAQTASGFRQRRRAARTARRIAALPPSLFDAAGALIGSADGSWRSATASNSVVIDLPVSAIHDVKPVRVESEAVRTNEPEPLALVAPVIEIAPVESFTAEPDPEPEPEPTAETEPAPVDPSPARAHRRRGIRIEHRWRLWGTTRPHADEPPAPAPEPEAEPLVAAAEVTPLADESVSLVEPEPEPIGVAEPEPEPQSLLAETLEAIVVATGEPEPEPEPDPEPIIDAQPEPEPIVAAAPKPPPPERRKPAPPAPRGAVDWQPSTSLWARRVFHAGSKRQQAVTWPRPYEPPADDLARDYIDAEVAESARAD
jgi:hypothetical protein